MNRTLSIAYAKELLELHEERGGDPELLLKKAGMSLSDTGDRISLGQYGKLHTMAMMDHADDFLGFPSGSAAPPGTFRMICLMMLHTKNIQEAMERGAELFGLIQGFLLVPVCTVEDNCLVIDRALSPNICKEEDIQEVDVLGEVSATMMIRGMLSWYHLVCWLAGRRLGIQKVELSYPFDPALASFGDIFQAPVSYDCESDRVYYNLSDLQTPVVQNEASLEIFLKACPSPLLVFADETRSAAERVRLLLGRDFSRPQPMAEVIAEQLGMSVSTLNRSLRAEGMTYQKIKDECRMEACVSYLAHPDLKLAEIAALTGFEETRSFFRFFRRETGMTPSEFREQLFQGET